jgi:HEPN domain-containing protein
MRENNQALTVVREWVAKADNDLKTAAHTLKLGEECPTDTICFHAQQCVEKYLKAYLVLKGVDFPKTHDIERLMALLPRGTGLPLTVKEQAVLTDYATAARYPGGGDIPIRDARQAVAIARRVRRHMRPLLRVTAWN